MDVGGIWGRSGENVTGVDTAPGGKNTSHEVVGLHIQGYRSTSISRAFGVVQVKVFKQVHVCTFNIELVRSCILIDT